MPFEIYLIIGITLLILGVLSFVKQIKEGMFAAVIGGGICIVVFIIHYIYNLTSNFFETTGITMKDIFTYIICIAVTCIAFVIIIALIKFLGIKKR
ncbi:hypothetical protein [uncultured Clostridium sp.]|jgi:hypothetical protein|uniref:hypothetical protein n=1 Tax=uncultured Clostridium sp. TaxID=59620 RepID=UPI00261CD723|nr:hypothetical protein [uncultured Clostridium sp.]